MKKLLCIAVINLMLVGCNHRDTSISTSGEQNHSIDIDSQDFDEFSESSGITISEAEEIALADANLTRNDVKYIHSYEEYKGHIPYSYAVEFGLKDDTQYQYRIEISSGKIITSYIENHESQ